MTARTGKRNHAAKGSAIFTPKAYQLSRISREKKFQFLIFCKRFVINTHKFHPEWPRNGKLKFKLIFHLYWDTNELEKICGKWN